MGNGRALFLTTISTLIGQQDILMLQLIFSALVVLI
jgi:hypothetical protein